MAALSADVLADLERENARLSAELRALRDRQAGSAEILRTIASTPADAGRSLQHIAETSARVFGAPSVSIQLAEDGQWGQAYRFGDSARSIRSAVPLAEIQISGRNMPGTVISENRQIHIPDLDHLDPSLADFPGLPHARAAGTRTMCGTPLRREQKAIGVLIVHRDQLLPFTEEELALQQSFADQAVIAIENTRLFNEKQEALDRQTATAEILKVIASSPSDVQPVFDAIAKSAKELSGAHSALVTRAIGDLVHLAAFTAGSEAGNKELQSSFPIQLFSEGIHSRVARTGELAFLTDIETEPDVPPALKEVARARSYRSILVVPMLHDGVAIGTIGVTRSEPGPFTDQVISLLRTFADQAVIAIENTRLFNETQEALERQTATADILKVIASSPTDVQPVFEVIVERAVRLCGGRMGRVYRYQDGIIWMVAGHGLSAPGLGKVQQVFPRPATDDTIVGEVMLSRRPYILADIRNDPSVPALSRQMIEALGTRSQVTMPMLLTGEPIGAITVGWAEPRAYTHQQITLLQTFADQAVIAIENVRLFNETREALERQTATADILKVIASSPSDVQPVFEAIAASANRLIGGFSTAVLRFVGDELHLAAFTPTNQKADAALKASFPRPLAEFPAFILVRDGETVEFTDTESDDVPQLIRDLARLRGYRSMVFTPLMSAGTQIGLISVTRKEPGSFAAHHVQLFRTFADQAVIAIENVRLFDEVQARTRDLSESLQQQTATADVLKVISRSTFDLKAVLTTLVQSARELCNAQRGVVLLRDKDVYRPAMQLGYPPEFEQYIVDHPVELNRHSGAGRAALTGKVAHFPDVLTDPEYHLDEGQRLGGYRALLSIPLLREGEVVGVFSLGRTEPAPFSERQIELVQTFADQAVIAIENVRLFDEVQAKTRELQESLEYQIATADVLNVISRSTTNVQPVFDAIAMSAARLFMPCETTLSTVHDGQLHWGATASLGRPVEAIERVRSIYPIPFDVENSPSARAIQERRIIEIADATAPDTPESTRRAQSAGEFRSITFVPLLREGIGIGTIILTHPEAGFKLSPKQLALVQTFADQAVIAIENARLFDEVQERTKELSRSLDDLRAAQDRLVQTEKLASLGQLTAGIAHEIKNPLNFVNNFSALSTELTDELNEVLKSAALTGKIRDEVAELTRMLKENLEKVVQHGKRADSIVKNMLLHSREGSGEHRPADINALLDESLNLAYHGARAEKPQFNVTLRRDFDQTAGTLEVFPQEITRVFLNLISNGFYAVSKRKIENGEAPFEPLLSAATRNLGDAVEVRIRDNGTGIPAEVKEKMFNPFFTTKPAGEGTGLGLSMSHDIIVKQHGGSIDVETEPGQFTEFRIILPRRRGVSDKR